uniref:Importin subunit alpha-4 n=1 Tax=Panagrellus redivivus TaxID=6233 RepID=A0A7E4UXN0_PANRE
MIIRTNDENPNIQLAAFVEIQKLLVSEELTETDLLKLAESMKAHCRQRTAWKLGDYLLPILAVLIRCQTSQVLIETLAALTEITENRGDGVDCNNKNIIEHLVPLLGHTDENIRKAALRAVGNLFTGGDEQTQAVLDCGVLPFLDHFLRHGDSKSQRDAIWCISNLAAGTPSQTQAIIDYGFVPFIISKLGFENKIQKEISWVIYSLIGSDQQKVLQYLIDENIIPPLCKHLEFRNKQLLATYLECLRDLIAKSQDPQNVCDRIMQCGGLEKVQLLKNNQNENIQSLASEICAYFIHKEQK